MICGKEVVGMKCEIIIDPNQENKVVIYTTKMTQLVENIEKLCADDDVSLIGYVGKNSEILDMSLVICFVVEAEKVFAMTSDGKYLLKSRLYQIEEMLSDNFIKINQSCIANIKKIKRFDASITGTLSVCFENGYKDYVSRRNVKKVKQKFGL